MNKTNAISSIVSFTALKFNAIPSSENIQIKPTIWNITGDYSKKWTAQNSIASPISVSYSIGDFAPDTLYNITVNGSILGTFTSDASGEINFVYFGAFDSLKTFEIKVP